MPVGASRLLAMGDRRPANHELAAVVCLVRGRAESREDAVQLHVSGDDAVHQFLQVFSAGRASVEHEPRLHREKQILTT